jgi:hypothetical protein
MTLAILVTCAALAQAQQRDPVRTPARDNPAPTAAGTASIVGTIVTDAEQPKPVRRAIVDINQVDGTFGSTVVTDDNGRFAATRLPAGQYQIRATKRGWVTTPYGAKSANRPGTALALSAGQRETISIRLPRAAVISGTLLDETGQPPTAVVLYVMRYIALNGERRLSRASGTSVGPDERGQYRIYGLAPGEYYVVASSTFFGVRNGSDLHLTSDVDVQQAVAAIQAGPSSPISDVAQRSVTLAPMYYPGVYNVAQAGAITVRAGEERSGVDFVVSYAASVHVEGTATGVDGAPARDAVITLVNADPNAAMLGFGPLKTARTDANGRFSFSEVTPGSYIIAARSAAPMAWAQADLDIQGEDVRGVSIGLQEAFTISGVIRLEGTSTPPSFTSVRVTLAPQTSGGGVVISSSTSAAPTEDGHFTITGVSPGRYRVSAFLPGPGNAPTWMMHSSTLGGQDAHDSYVDVRQSLTDASIVLTDQFSVLSGHARPGSTVTVFSTDHAQWYQGSHRMVVTRAAADGSYTIRNVPAGEYYVADVDDPEPGQISDPAFLETLTSAATKIAIADGEKKIVDLRGGGM